MGSNPFLGFASPSDKIVQAAVKVKQQAGFSPYFASPSHSFSLKTVNTIEEHACCQHTGASSKVSMMHARFTITLRVLSWYCGPAPAPGVVCVCICVLLHTPVYAAACQNLSYPPEAHSMPTTLHLLSRALQACSTHGGPNVVQGSITSSAWTT